MQEKIEISLAQMKRNIEGFNRSLTFNERELLCEIIETMYETAVNGMDGFWEQMQTWEKDINKDGFKPRQYAGIVGSLTKKGLISVDEGACNDRNSTLITATEKLLSMIRNG